MSDRFRFIDEGGLATAIAAGLQAPGNDSQSVEDRSVIAISIGQPREGDHHASIIAIEALGAHAVVSPLLGDEGFCRSCWRLRRLAAWAATALALDEPHRLLSDFRRGTLPPAAAWTRQQLAGVRAAIVWQSRAGLSPGALATPIIVMPTGEMRAEWVIGRPDCPRCRPRLLRAGQRSAADLPGEAALVGGAAGIVTRLEDIPALPGEPTYPFVVRATLANTWFATTPSSLSAASGKAASLDSAKATALGEAIERYAAMSVPRDLLMARPRELALPTLDARALHGLTEEQIVALGLARDDEVQAWVPARTPANGDEVALPAAAVYTRSPLGCRPAIPFTTNGVACDESWHGASRAALDEVLERDRFFEVWYGRPKAARSTIGIAGPEWQSAHDAFTAAQIAVTGWDLGDVNGVHIAACVLSDARNGATRPRRVIGLGHGSSLTFAAIGALREAGQVYRGLTYELRIPAIQDRRDLLAANPELIREPLDHALAFTAMFPLNQQIGGLAPPIGAPEGGPSPPLYAIDITPLDIAAVTARRVVRVVAPGRIPYHVGSNQIPWRILQRRIPGLQARSCLPHPLC